MRGAYGVAGRNQDIPRTHFYLTVDKNLKKSEIYDDIKTQFEYELEEREPKDFFELRPEPRKPPTFKFLGRPSVGGGIVRKEKTRNPMLPNDIIDEVSGTCQPSGTLTMFCVQEKIHYALTCYHVGVALDREKYSKAFNQEDLLALYNLRSSKWSKEQAKATIKYSYSGKDCEDETTSSDLGTFSDASFDNVSDIMSIEVNKDVKVECKVPNMDVPDWTAIWDYLQEHVYDGDIEARVHGYSSNTITGNIDDINYCVPYQGKMLIKSAVSLKGHSREFLGPGDSGALVDFVDEESRRHAFAYCVCEVEEDVVFGEEKQSAHENRNEPLFICYRLDTAFDKLKIQPEEGCFHECGGSEGGKSHLNIHKTLCKMSELKIKQKFIRKLRVDRVGIFPGFELRILESVRFLTNTPPQKCGMKIAF